MSRTRRLTRSRALAGTVGAIALAGTLALSGCGTGQLAQTADQRAAVNGTGAQQGSIAIRDLQIVYPQRAAAPDAVYARGGAAPLQFGMVNQGATADRLVRVSSPAATAVTITGDATLPQDVLLVGGGETGTAPQGTRPVGIELTGLTQPIQAGLSVPVTFQFERAGSTTVQVPVGTPAEGAAEPERADSEAAPGGAGATPGAQQPAAPEGGN